VKHTAVHWHRSESCFYSETTTGRGSFGGASGRRIGGVSRSRSGRWLVVSRSRKHWPGVKATLIGGSSKEGGDDGCHVASETPGRYDAPGG